MALPTNGTATVSDVSKRALRIARMIDRLPPGEFSVVIIKPEVHNSDWQVEILRTEKMSRAVLPKYLPE